MVCLGITAINFLSSSGMLVSISLPYAPVSSDVSQISTTPSDIAYLALATIASGSYDPNFPLACLVLQYVHEPRQPVDNGIISMN